MTPSKEYPTLSEKEVEMFIALGLGHLLKSLFMATGGRKVGMTKEKILREYYRLT